MCRLSRFLDPGGWSKTAAVGLYFIFPGICTLSLVLCSNNPTPGTNFDISYSSVVVIEYPDQKQLTGERIYFVYDDITLNLIGEKVGDNFLNITPAAQTLRLTIDKYDLMKLKSFYKGKFFHKGTTKPGTFSCDRTKPLPNLSGVSMVSDHRFSVAGFMLKSLIHLDLMPMKALLFLNEYGGGVDGGGAERSVSHLTCNRTLGEM
ncbi:hypothetical protein STEG23_021592 [Scotinomys teguina]